MFKVKISCNVIFCDLFFIYFFKTRLSWHTLQVWNFSRSLCISPSDSVLWLRQVGVQWDRASTRDLECVNLRCDAQGEEARHALSRGPVRTGRITKAAHRPRQGWRDIRHLEAAEPEDFYPKNTRLCPTGCLGYWLSGWAGWSLPASLSLCVCVSLLSAQALCTPVCWHSGRTVRTTPPCHWTLCGYKARPTQIHGDSLEGTADCDLCMKSGKCRFIWKGTFLDS